MSDILLFVGEIFTFVGERTAAVGEIFTFVGERTAVVGEIFTFVVDRPQIEEKMRILDNLKWLFLIITRHFHNTIHIPSIYALFRSFNSYLYRIQGNYTRTV